MTDFSQYLYKFIIDTVYNIPKLEELYLCEMLTTPISFTEAHIIKVIGLSGTISITSLATELKITLPSTTVAVKKLESKGYIAKTRCEIDGRKTAISLTEIGSQAYFIHNMFHERIASYIIEDFNQEEIGVLFTALSRINDFIENKIKDDCI